MIDNYNELCSYFEYYKYNETLLIDSTYYLSLDVANSDSFSMFYSSLLINICIDFSSLCKKYFNREKINNYSIKNIIDDIKADNILKGVFDERASIYNTNYIEMDPYLIMNESFIWWSHYNKIKHIL